MSPEIKAYIDQQIHQSAVQQRFGINAIPRHVHNGTDSPNVSQKDIVPNIRVLGDINMDTNNRVYTLGITFNPTSLLFLGACTDTPVSNNRAIIIGNAQLGKTRLFQASTSSSVTTGGALQNLIQASTQFWSIGSGTHVWTSQTYLADINGAARLTVVGYSNTGVQVKCSFISGAWANFVGTFIVT